jgi:aldose 1-epimerase
MYSVHAEPNRIQLSCARSQVEIWPLQGAIINKWQVQHRGQTLSLIEGYNDANDFARHAESKGFRSCKLSPYVCRIANSTYHFENREYKIGKFVLNGCSLHGLLYDVPYEVVKYEAGEEYSFARLKYQYEGRDNGYPFPYEVLVTYSLSDEAKITLTTQITNKHSQPIPMADGWHPYFCFETTVDNLELRLASDTRVVFDDRLIPTGALAEDRRFVEGLSLKDLSLDDCFVLNNPGGQPVCELIWPERNARIALFNESNYPFLQVYTPPHRKSIAIENLSAAPDAFNNQTGLHILEAGASVSFSASYLFSEG